MTEQATNTYLFMEKVAELRKLMLEKHPKMPTLLREIHTAILKNPEQVTILSEPELEDVINGVVQGLEIHTNTKLVEAATSTKNSSVSKKLKVDPLAALGG